MEYPLGDMRGTIPIPVEVNEKIKMALGPRREKLFEDVSGQIRLRLNKEKADLKKQRQLMIESQRLKTVKTSEEFKHKTQE